MSPRTLSAAVLGGLVTVAPLHAALASSHMDSPLITFDDPANTTDVYAFVTQAPDGSRHLSTALAVYPFEEPGIGPNVYRFDERVRYNIHVALDDSVDHGDADLTYSFEFATDFANVDTTLQAFLGEVEGTFGPSQNLRQRFTVTRTDHRTGQSHELGVGAVPPNNQGLVTPFYNQNDDGEMPAKGGVDSHAELDIYTKLGITALDDGHVAFAGQRDDGFFADIQSIFDLDFTFSGPNKPFDSQRGFNVHTIVLNIPIDGLDDATRAGVFATTERSSLTMPGGLVETHTGNDGDDDDERFVQVARQGNPLFNEGFVALRDKVLYNRTLPDRDEELFLQYALQPELATVLGLPDMNREDLAAIFIPDLIKVDLTTPPARLAGEQGFSRLSVFGGDTLMNAAGQTVAGGWPNGRRFGDDVLDIAVIALGLDPAALDPAVGVDGVVENDITYNRTFPYAATPLNGRNHTHHGLGDNVGVAGTQ